MFQVPAIREGPILCACHFGTWLECEPWYSQISCRPGLNVCGNLHVEAMSTCGFNSQGWSSRCGLLLVSNLQGTSLDFLKNLFRPFIKEILCYCIKYAYWKVEKRIHFKRHRIYAIHTHALYTIYLGYIYSTICFFHCIEVSGRWCIWICSPEVHWALLRICQGNEGEEFQGGGDTIQLNKQISSKNKLYNTCLMENGSCGQL